MKKRGSLLILALCVILLIYDFKTCGTIVSDVLFTKTSHAEQAEYKGLFTEQARNDMILFGTTKSRNRKPTSTYTYHNSDYNLYVYQLKLLNNGSLNDILSYRNVSNTEEGSYGFFTPLGGYDIDIKQREEKLFSASKINLISTGDSTKVIAKNDSLQCYYLKFKTFAISYDSKSYDIIAKAQESIAQISVAFEKKGQTLYVILMSAAEKDAKIQPDQLYKLLKK